MIHITGSVGHPRGIQKPPRAAAAFRVALAVAAVVLPLATWVADRPAAAGLVALAEAAAAAVWWRPSLLAPLVAVLLPAGDRIEVVGVQASPLEAVVAGGAIGYVACWLLRLGIRAPGAAHWAYGAFCLAVALSALGPADTSARLRDLVLWAALGAVLHAAATETVPGIKHRLLLGGLGVAVAVEAAVALWEYVDGRAERFSLRGGAIVFPLPRGTFDHPNALAQFLAVGLLLALALGAGERRLVRRAAQALAAAAAAALVVTFSRASWVSASAGGAVWLLDPRARRPVALIAAVVAALALGASALGAGAIGARVSSLTDIGRADLTGFRLELVGRGLDVVADHPLTGVGVFEEVGVYAGRPDVVTHPHNLLLGVAVFYGIPAAIAFAALLALAFVATCRRVRERDGAGPWRTAVGLLAVLVTVVVNGLFEYPLRHPSLAALWVLALGLALGPQPFARPGQTSSDSCR